MRRASHSGTAPRHTLRAPGPCPSTPAREERPISANDLSTLLWRERELLDLLVFKLEEEQLLLTAGRSKWLHHATREVEAVLARLRTTGIERTVLASQVALAWGLAEDATLRQLAEAAPDPVWRDVLQSHLTALTALTAQIADVRDTNLTYLRAATRATQETLATVGTGAPAEQSYGGRGSRAHAAPPAAYLFDRRG